MKGVFLKMPDEEKAQHIRSCRVLAVTFNLKGKNFKDHRKDPEDILE